MRTSEPVGFLAVDTQLGLRAIGRTLTAQALAVGLENGHSAYQAAGIEMLNQAVVSRFG